MNSWSATLSSMRLSSRRWWADRGLAASYAATLASLFPARLADLKPTGGVSFKVQASGDIIIHNPLRREKDFINYVKGANIAGFKKVADAMIDLGV